MFVKHPTKNKFINVSFIISFHYFDIEKTLETHRVPKEHRGFVEKCNDLLDVVDLADKDTKKYDELLHRYGSSEKYGLHLTLSNGTSEVFIYHRVDARNEVTEIIISGGADNE